MNWIDKILKSVDNLEDVIKVVKALINALDKFVDTLRETKIESK